MNQIYLVISIAALVILIVFAFLLPKQKEKNRITPLAGLAFGFVLAGILFGEERILGYSLFGIGIILSIVDIIRNKKGQR
jgi:predicted Kef-type K+ transport protein